MSRSTHLLNLTSIIIVSYLHRITIALGVIHFPISAFHYNCAMITMTTTQQNRTFSIIRWQCRVVHQLLCGTTFTIVLQNGWSALMDASLNGHVQVVAELLQHGARVDLQDKV